MTTINWSSLTRQQVSKISLHSQLFLLRTISRSMLLLICSKSSKLLINTFLTFRTWLILNSRWCNSLFKNKKCFQQFKSRFLLLFKNKLFLFLKLQNNNYLKLVLLLSAQTLTDLSWNKVPIESQGATQMKTSSSVMRLKKVLSSKTLCTESLLYLMVEHSSLVVPETSMEPSLWKQPKSS